MEMTMPHSDVNRGLFWVQGDLSKALERARAHIESYLEDAANEQSALKACLKELSEIANISAVIQCYSVHLLASEMIETVRHAIDTAQDDGELNFAALVAATLQVSDYIELLAHGETDHPLVFAPNINDLRVARGAQAQSRAVLFTRFLDERGLEVEPPADPQRRKPGMSRALAAKHTPVMQKAVLGVIRDLNRQRSLQVLGKATDQLASVAVDPQVYLCWRGVSLMCDALAREPELINPDVQKLVAKSGQCVKALSQGGEKAIAKAAGRLGAQCMHLGTLTEASSPLIDAVRQEYALGGSDVTYAHLKALRERLAKPNIDSLQTVTREIRHNLHDIKDSIDLALRSNTLNETAPGLVGRLESVAATLQVVGLDNLSQLASTQAEAVAGLVDGIEADDWMPIAEALLRIEQELETELMPAVATPLVHETAHQDLREGVTALLREALVNISRVKSEINQYLLKGQEASLDSAQRLLAEMGAGFEILGQDNIRNMLSEVSALLSSQDMARARTSSVIADRIADVISAAEYYLEALQDKQPRTESLLDNVQRMIASFKDSLLSAEQDQPDEAPVELEAETEIDPEFREIFIEEAREVLGELTGIMPAWSQDPSQEEAMAVVRRAFHTLKGSGRMVGARDIGEFAWSIEHLLNRCIDGDMTLGGDVSALVTQAVDLLPQVIEHFSSAKDASALVAPIQQKAELLLNGGQDVAADEADVLSIFREDAREQLSELAAQLENASDGMLEADQDLERRFHGLRGGAATAGLEHLATLAASAERLTQALRTLSQAMPLDLATRLHGGLSQLLDIEPGNEQVLDDATLEQDIDSLLNELQSSTDGIDLELAAIFAEEAADLLQQAESELQNWAAQPDSESTQRNLQRIFHTIKGSARTAGGMGLGQVGEALDALMKNVLAGQYTAIGQELFSRLGEVVLQTYSLLDEFREGRDADPSSVLAILNGESAELVDVPTQDKPDALEAVASDDEFSEADVDQVDAGPSEQLTPVVTPTPPPELSAEPAGSDEDHWPPDEEILEMFMEEGQDLLESMDSHFATWEAAPADGEPLRALQRDLHTFKGGARLAGLNSIGSIAHEMESTFARLESGDLSSDVGAFGRLHNALDGLHELLDGVKNGQRPVGAQDLLDDLREAGKSAELTPLDLGEVAEQPAAEAETPQQDEAVELEMVAPEEPEDILLSTPELDEPVEEESVPELHVDEAAEEPAQDGEPAIELSLDESPAEIQSELEPELESESEPELEVSAEASRDDDLDAEMVEIFLPEGQELMEAFDAAHAGFADAPEQSLSELLRVLHTLKGGARMAGLSRLGEESHQLESDLEEMKLAGDIDAANLGGRLQQASDLFHGELQRAKALASGGVLPPQPESIPAPADIPETPTVEEEPAESAVIEPTPELAPVLPVDPAAPPPRPWAADLQWEAPQDERLAAIRRETARVGVDKLDSMLNEAGEISIYRSRLERQVNDFAAQLREVDQTIVRIRDQLRMLESETDAQIQARKQGLQSEEDGDRYGEEFDPLEMDRYSRMQELTRALTESVTDLSSLHATMTEVVSETDTLLLQQGRVNTSVQQGLMSTLMVPFSRQVQRLQRVARQTASEHGKQVELALNGIESEMDRNVLERMTPVIEHVLRNCVIHGIEDASGRRAAGKPSAGNIQIALTRDGSKLAIEIRDDGRGLDFNRIREKAIERGMMTADAKLSDAELAQFIFHPGFSTAQTLTQDAGRGVGMDVVSSEIKQLGGTLELDSKTGQGTRFLIRLPLSLAISQALLVQVGEEVYATPLSTIEGIARVPAAELANYMDEDHRFSYGENEYRVRYLGQLLGQESVLPEGRDYVPVILVHTGEGMGISDRRVAVAVDQLLGSRELVTKTAGPQVSTVVGVTGATIQSDGRVVLILDVIALVQDRLFKTLQSGEAYGHGGKTEQAPLVMVIDDSITMRRVAERLLSRNGYRVATAKDGMDGIAMLQTESPDAVLLDIEMPKVDGFEVATFIRNNERLSNLPIIMITSRSGDKHRERAKTIGVNRYLIKPYQEQQLITELRSIMGEEA